MIKLVSLHPNHTYSVWVRAYSSNLTYSESYVVNIKTFPEPQNITLRNTTPYSLEITWKAPEHVTRYLIKYKSSSMNNLTWVEIFDSFATHDLDDELVPSLETLLIENLTPKTQYHFVMFLYYEKRADAYVWPIDRRFIYETLGDVPSAPGKPTVKHLSGDAYQVIWEPSRDNGAIIEEYVLEGLQRRKEIVTGEGETKVDDQEYEDGEWENYYNGTNTYWITRNMRKIRLFGFKVRAKNSYGWSNYSTESEPVTEFNVSGIDTNYMVTIIIVSVFVILLIALAVAVIFGESII